MIGAGVFLGRRGRAGLVGNSESLFVPTALEFNGVTLLDYFDPQPAGLNGVFEAFTADTGQFTRYTEGTQGTFNLTGGEGQIVHDSGSGTHRNDIITVSGGAAFDEFTQPCLFVCINVTGNAVQSAGYDNVGVGIVKDAGNFLFAGIDRAGGTARIQVKIGGSNTFKASVPESWTAPFRLGLSLVGNSACVWKKIGSGAWTYLTGAWLTEHDFQTVGNLTGWKPGFTLASQDNATWTFDDLAWGSFGGVGMRDQTIVTYQDGSTYTGDAGHVYFSATLADPRGVGYAGVFRLNMTTLAYEQTAALFVERGGRLFNDLVPHIIRNGSNSRITIATWGNGFGNALEVLTKDEIGVNLLAGVHNIGGMTALTLPGHASGYGEYDAMLAHDGTRWLLAYTITQNTSFAGNPFYAALAYSVDLATWYQIGSPDTGHMGYEGTKLVRVGGNYFVTAGGPAGAGDNARVYDVATFTHQGTLDAGFYGGVDTQPHAAMFYYGDYCYLLSFDNTRYGGAVFTWGQPTLQRAWRTAALLELNKAPADDEFDVGSAIDTAGTRRTGALAWGWVNQGTATANQASDQLSLAIPGSASTAYRGVEQAISGSAWRVRAKMKASLNQTNYASCGLYVGNSGSSKSVFLGYNYASIAGFEGFRGTFPNPFQTGITSGVFLLPGDYLGQWKYFEVESDGTNLLLRTSVDGCRWTLRATEPLAAWVVDVDRVGLFANSENSNAVTGIYDWLRRIA